MFSSRDPCESCDCEVSSADPPPLPPAPCAKDCCDSGWDAAEEPEAPTPPVPPVLLQAAETHPNQIRSELRTAARGEGIGRGISPGREDGDGAEVARLVDLKLHGLLCSASPLSPVAAERGGRGDRLPSASGSPANLN